MTINPSPTTASLLAATGESIKCKVFTDTWNMDTQFQKVIDTGVPVTSIIGVQWRLDAGGTVTLYHNTGSYLGVPEAGREGIAWVSGGNVPPGNTELTFTRVGSGTFDSATWDSAIIVVLIFYIE